MLQQITNPTETRRYARCIEASKRIRWEIDADVIRGRTFDYTRKFLPDGLSQVNTLEFLNDTEQRLLSQIQGRTYANIFGLVERFINAKVLEISREHWLGNQTALEALVRFSDEELKHQEMFRRLDLMMADGMPAGYQLVPQADAVASVVLGKSTWAVLGLTCHIEIFTQAHYRASIEPDAAIDPLWKDVFMYHWREESQHAIVDELEWRREHARLSPAERDQAVDDLIELVGAVDGILQAQSAVDIEYFARIAGRAFHEREIRQLRDGVLRAYRCQYILSGVQEPRFAEIIGSLITDEQGRRIAMALVPLTQ